MPEYLAPGVYIEETSFRTKSIEGVSTSTAGFVGPALFGPISGPPELITSLADFTRIYGGLDDLNFGGESQRNYLAHGVRAFFDEGGKRLYVQRVFRPDGESFDLEEDNPVPTEHYATSLQADTITTPPPDPPLLVLAARFPGSGGNMRVYFTLRAGDNVFRRTVDANGNVTVSISRIHSGDLVHVRVPSGAAPPADPWSASGSADGLMIATQDKTTGAWTLSDPTAALTVAVDAAFAANAQVRLVTMVVEAAHASGIPPVFGARELLGEFSFDPHNPVGLSQVFTASPINSQNFLTIPFAIDRLPTTVTDATRALYLARTLIGAAGVAGLLTDARPTAVSYTLAGGTDGQRPIAGNYAGLDVTDFSDYQNDPQRLEKNGLRAFEAVEAISIVAAPGYSYSGATPNEDNVFAIQLALVAHCEKMRYRVAVLDTPPDLLVTGALNFRNRGSSIYAALYYPWVVVSDPLNGQRLELPPSGFIAGIYARNDIERTVSKAPANEVVRLALDFEYRLNKAQQEVLNPEGVNCFRFFPGRGNLVWGARTIGDDPEWKYISVRRYFCYLEHSIDRGTQWVVFESNTPALWANVRRTVEDFLLNEWKMGNLMGEKPEQAYFVRCDLTTMTQNDIDNGRLVCLIGVAPVRPAEFVIFRIGQWTATTTT
jgi:phage tail sheath protein FI